MPTFRRKDVPPEVWAKLQAAPGGVSPPTASASRAELVAAAFAPPATWVLPLVTASEVNGRDWRARSARTKDARKAVSKATGPTLRHVAPAAEHYHAGGRVRVVLTRLGGRPLDRSNLPTALKAVEDALAVLMGADDGDPRWCAEWHQEPGGPCGVRVELSLVEDAG